MNYRDDRKTDVPEPNGRGNDNRDLGGGNFEGYRLRVVRKGLSFSRRRDFWISCDRNKPAIASFLSSHMHTFRIFHERD
jgi:hypothetical protein